MQQPLPHLLSSENTSDGAAISTCSATRRTVIATAAACATHAARAAHVTTISTRAAFGPTGAAALAAALAANHTWSPRIHAL